MAEFGLGQIGLEPPKWLKVLANTMIIACAIIAWIVSPMPTEWVPTEIKVYILTVTSSSGVLKVIEKLTGKGT
jgi:Sec-independent protein secretion pathway component TatC